MKILKQRVAILLAFLMTFSFVANIAPSSMSTVEAASQWYIYSNIFAATNPGTLQIEAGTKNAYLGDFIYTNNYKKGRYTRLSMLSGATYTSSNKKVLNVNKKTGICVAKKTGTSTVKIKFAGNTIKAKVKVVKKDTFNKYRTSVKAATNNKPKTVSYKKFEKNAEAILKAYGKKLTGSNMFRVLKEIKACPGYVGTMGYEEDYSNSSTTIYWLSPAQTHAQAILTEIDDYASAHYPFSTSSAYCFKLSSVSGSSKTVTAYLKKAVSKGQMLSIERSHLSSAKQVSSKHARFPIYVRDMATQKNVKGTATITCNSKKITIKTKSKLISGHTYELADEYKSINPKGWIRYNTPVSGYRFVAK